MRGHDIEITAFGFPPRYRFLDARETPEPSLAEAVWIPFSQLRTRLSELPPPTEAVQLPDGYVPEGLESFLARGGRRFLRRPATLGPCTPGRLWEPHPWLVANVPRLEKTRLRVADLGCGAGRECAFLTALGHEVTGIDHLADAVDAAKSMVCRYGDPSKFRGLVANFDDWEPSEPIDLVLALMAVPLDLASRAYRWGALVLGEAYTREWQEEHRVPRDARRVFVPAPTLESLESLREGCRYYRSKT